VTINLSEAKAHLGQYVAKAGAGEVITICERNRPVAELRPAGTSRSPRKLKVGLLKGQFNVPEDFDAPLPDFEGAFYDDSRAKAQTGGRARE
jgi:prevent-host-death family protein